MPGRVNEKRRERHLPHGKPLQPLAREASPRLNGGVVAIPMNYQLVIKFWRKSLQDETFLAAIQDELKDGLGDAAKLDGYDVSDDEINLFVVTPDPRRSFRRIKTVLESRGVLPGVSAASRLEGGAHFTSIWPPRATRKFKLP